MSGLLEQIERGVRARPRRILVHGGPGIGKTTFAAHAPRPVFICTESGAEDANTERFPLAQSYDAVMQAIGELYSKEHPYESVVIDSLDWFERLVWQKVCESRGKKSIEDFDFGKGYQYAVPLWQEFLEGLNALNKQRNMWVISIAHAAAVRHNPPGGVSYDRWAPAMHKKANAIVCEDAEDILFARLKVFEQEEDQGFGKVRTIARSSQQRIILTAEDPAYIAKNRCGLPHEIPLDWLAYQGAVDAHYAGSQQQPAEQGEKEAA